MPATLDEEARLKVRPYSKPVIAVSRRCGGKQSNLSDWCTAMGLPRRLRLLAKKVLE